MREIDTSQLETTLSQGAQLVDVREPVEFVQGHVPGARLIPMGQLSARMSEINRDEPVYVVCASGNRSSAMTDMLVTAGYDAWSVAGGTKAWIDSGRPVEEVAR